MLHPHALWLLECVGPTAHSVKMEAGRGQEGVGDVVRLCAVSNAGTYLQSRYGTRISGEAEISLAPFGLLHVHLFTRASSNGHEYLQQPGTGTSSEREAQLPPITRQGSHLLGRLSRGRKIFEGKMCAWFVMLLIGRPTVLHQV